MWYATCRAHAHDPPPRPPPSPHIPPKTPLPSCTLLTSLLSPHPSLSSLGPWLHRTSCAEASHSLVACYSSYGARTTSSDATRMLGCRRMRKACETCDSWPRSTLHLFPLHQPSWSLHAGQGADRLQLCGRFFLTFIFFFQVPHARLGPLLTQPLHCLVCIADAPPPPVQAIYDEHGGLHKAFTKPSFLGICASLLLLVLSGLVCAGFKTEWCPAPD